MEFSSKAKVFGFVALAAAACFSGRAGAQPPKSAWVGPLQVDNSIKVLHLRKAARKMLGIGKPQDDESPLDLGATRARFLWQKGWKWSEMSSDSRLPIGLQGGPMLSLELPIFPVASLFSLEARLCSLRYVFAKPATQRPRSDELVDPQRLRQSVEAGLYLNVALGRLH